MHRCREIDCARAPRYSPQGCDAVHDPERDLSFVYRAEHVYPEFLVQIAFCNYEAEGGRDEEWREEDEDWLPTG